MQTEEAVKYPIDPHFKNIFQQIHSLSAFPTLDFQVFRVAFGDTFLSYSIDKTTFSFFDSYLANVTNVSIVSTVPHTLLFLLSYTIQKASE